MKQAAKIKETDARRRERLQREVDSLKPEQVKLATELLRLLKAGRTIVSPAP